ncbi:MAG: DUF58 domain-containing protein [Candidatus Omnitrophica bacterium]|nr:DUF58 domain-containing protein [Candidatus Omnitrophota bacterium]MCA9415266.1 DUF58 domain-containing protein [Candidatus Omnitrophota bacterium]MCA9423920.1 DUF58 domain-containing protein [Candidatus Omnitrophota bacterium]MCA9429815.1 DUF58 domain-containing protein [Candidatus Omnitrophota bacterium]MCA9435604.1 DUF58 domain-containing protein [Candidatus Omnitrophota bacterium]
MAEDEPVEKVLQTDSDRARRIQMPSLSGVSQVGIQARRVAEGLLSGQHSSRQFGQNIEFSDYREYVPGDDLRHIDWRAYARSDRYYIKRFEAETAVRACIMLDVSKSMLYGEGDQHKMQYSADLAAAIATLLISQKDSVGLALFDEELRFWLEPVGSPEQLRRVYRALEQVRPQNKTQTGPTLQFVAQHFKRRGFLVLISDFWDDVEKTLKGLNHFAHRKFEVLVFHILHPDEIEFPFLGSLEIKGLEEGVLETEGGRHIQKAFVERHMKQREDLKAGCTRLGIDYNLISTDEPLHRSLLRVLSARRQVRG